MTRKFKVLGLLVMALALIVAPAANASTFFIVTDKLADGQVGSTYNQTLRASASNVTWSLAGGQLPKTLSLTNGSNGVGIISGSLTEPGDFQFTISATDGTYADARSFAIHVDTAPINVEITTEALNAGTIGSDYIDIITANVTGATFTRTSGSLPDGLEFDTDTGIISGRPSSLATTSSFTVTATAGGYTSTPKTFTIAIAADPVDILTNILPNGTAGSDYAAELISNKTSGVTWRMYNSDTLPNNLTLNPSTGIITGTPATPGIYEFAISVTDGTTTATKAFTIKIEEPIYINGQPTTFTINNDMRLADGTVNTPYTGVQFTSTPAATSWAVTNGALPAGMNNLTDNGYLGGQPTAAGTYLFEVTAYSNNQAVARKYFMLTVNPAGGAYSINDPLELYATIGENFRTQLTSNISGAKWTVTGLPGSFSYNPDTGVITAYPVNANALGTTYLNVTAYANGMTATATITLIVQYSTDSNNGGGGNNTTHNANIYPSRINANRGVTMPKDQQFSVTGVTRGDIKSWSISALPAGFLFDTATGTLSGKPERAGTTEVTVTARTLTATYSGTVILAVAGDNSEDDDSGDCNAGITLYALSLVGSFFILRRKH